MRASVSALLALSIVGSVFGVFSVESAKADPVMSAGKPEWASLVVGRKKDKTIVGGICTDKANDETARSCAINDFIKGGGDVAISARSWQCKGWIAAAVSNADGAYDVVWCRPDKAKAEDDAFKGCQKSGGKDCKVVFTQKDLK